MRNKGKFEDVRCIKCDKKIGRIVMPKQTGEYLTNAHGMPLAHTEYSEFEQRWHGVNWSILCPKCPKGD